ncbi:hypothetical protein KQ693_10390 [Thermus sp. PS18]|uniref:hypothetical protein n=1 Tax=Thermus sp. PS18 TaxID=2849039 RepID=UPI0022645F93|nr:hypothetical protein [Thermus sp. PS18]UZX15024.1 hypothetical protein KQ693_10390 [Thermus sp. PS18]
MNRIDHPLEGPRLVMRLLELPGLIGEVKRQMTALRAERRELERWMEAREAQAYLEVQAKTDRERQARARTLLAQVPDWQKAERRLNQILTQLDKLQAELEVLEHERKAIYGALVARHTEALETALAQGFFGARPPAPRGGN